MIVAGCDVGSSTVKAVVVVDGSLRSTAIDKITATPVESAHEILQQALCSAGLCLDDLDCCCGTGYGRFELPFADLNMSEISCHGLGAFASDNSIRTIIDIGGQDCKVISVDEEGRVNDFIMNDKCAAGTGRTLEILSRLIDVPVESLGSLSSKSRKPVEITNKCGIFMELDVINALAAGKKKKDIASGLSDSVARRAVALAASMDTKPGICVTGGVAKNISVIRQLEKKLNCKMKSLRVDSQIIGALGAALFAAGSCSCSMKEITIA